VVENLLKDMYSLVKVL